MFGYHLTEPASAPDERRHTGRATQLGHSLMTQGYEMFGHHARAEHVVMSDRVVPTSADAPHHQHDWNGFL
jgi:hypothetical protein